MDKEKNKNRREFATMCKSCEVLVNQTLDDHPAIREDEAAKDSISFIQDMLTNMRERYSK